MRVRKPLLIVFIAVLSLTVVGWVLLRHLDQYIDSQIGLRVVPNDSDVLMAVDTEGIEYLYALYAVPKSCGDPAFAMSEQVTWVLLCMKGVKVTPEQVRNGTVLVPAGTKAKALGANYVLEEGRFAPPSYSPRNINAMHRDGAIQVEQIQIIEGSEKNSVGWVLFGTLQATSGPFVP